MPQGPPTTDWYVDRLTCGATTTSGQAALRAILILSDRELLAAWAQQDPQYWGMCCKGETGPRSSVTLLVPQQNTHTHTRTYLILDQGEVVDAPDIVPAPLIRGPRPRRGRLDGDGSRTATGNVALQRTNTIRSNEGGKEMAGRHLLD